MASIQDQIDKHLGEEGKYQRTIALNKATGPVNLPDDCYLSLNACTIANMTIGNNCTVVVEQSTITGTVTVAAVLGNLTLDKTTISGNLDITGNSVTVKLCNLTNSTNKFTGSSLNSYKNQWIGGAVKVEFDDSSGIFRDDVFTGSDTVFLANNFSSGTFRSCELVGTNYGIKLDNNSKAEVLSGKLIGSGNTALLADNKSTFTLSSLSEIIGSLYCVKADNGSTGRVMKTPKLEATEYCIYANNQSTIELSQFDKATAGSNAVVWVGSESNFIGYKGTELNGSGAYAIFSDAARCEVREITRIVCSAGNGYQSIGSSKLIVNKVDDFRGEQSSLVFADDDIADIKDSLAFVGQSAVCIKAGSGCTLNFKSIKSITAQNDTALVTGEGTKVNFHTIGTVTGQKGECAKIGENGYLSCYAVDTMEGLDGDAIQFGKGASFKYKKGILVYGKKYCVVGEEVTLEINEFGTFHGFENSCIVLDGRSTVKIWDGELIFGEGSVSENVGDAIKLRGSGNSLLVYNVLKIFGKEGDGIYLSGGKGIVYSIPEIIGGGRAIKCKDKGHIEATSIGELDGAEGAIDITDDSSFVGNSLGDIKAGAKSGIQAQNSVITINVCGSVGGNPASVDCIGSTVSIYDAESIEQKVASSDSTLTITNTTIKKELLVNLTVLKLSKVTVEKEAAISYSNVDTFLTGFQKDCPVIGTSMNCKSTEFDQKLTLTESSLIGNQISVSELVMAVASLISVGSTYGSKVIDGGSFLNAGSDGIITHLCDYMESTVTFDATLLASNLTNTVSEAIANTAGTSIANTASTSIANTASTTMTNTAGTSITNTAPLHTNV